MKTWASQKLFSAVHSNNLVYNTCWEDPRIDRQVLKINEADRILMITSAGCNALDYLLDNPKSIHCVDMNSRQNALLELKIAGIKSLDFETFFQIFGRGAHVEFKDIYRKQMRPLLSESAKSFWDEKYYYFEGSRFRTNFYARGTSGMFGQAFRLYIQWSQVKDYVIAMFECQTVDEQREIYRKFVKPFFWSPAIEKVMGWDAALALLGVPRAQRLQVERDYHGGIFQFAKDSVETVFTELPLNENYFWWLYVNGKYTKERCPEYLKKHNFEVLRQRVERVQLTTGSILDTLKNSEQDYSKFVLLDHMDWMSVHASDVLAEQWEWILKRSQKKGSRIIWRSGAFKNEFITDLVMPDGLRVSDHLHFQDEIAAQLHVLDRVHTYASFHIADVRH